MSLPAITWRRDTLMCRNACNISREFIFMIRRRTYEREAEAEDIKEQHLKNIWSSLEMTMKSKKTKKKSPQKIALIQHLRGRRGKRRYSNNNNNNINNVRSAIILTI